MRPEEEINSAFLAAYADELQGAAGTTDQATAADKPSAAGAGATRRAAYAARPFARLADEVNLHTQTLRLHNWLLLIMLVIMLIILFRLRR